MKRFLFLLFCLVPAGLAAAESADAQAAPTVRLLTIGNSFADDSTRYLRKMADADGAKLVFYPLNLSGHSLGQHASYLKAFEADPGNLQGRPYRHPAKPGTKISLPEALAAEKWDYVTIQQVSTKSFRPETYEPAAGRLIAAIRKYAPQAEILILETWAYRQDHSFFESGELTQQSMYDRLHAAYRQLGENHGLRIIPIGTAFQAARRNPRWQFSYPDPNFNYQKPEPGTLPDQKGSLNTGWRWIKLTPDSKPSFGLDAIHANTAGGFLATATLYEFLFKQDVRNNSFIPKGLPPEDAAQLREIAHETVADSKPVPTSGLGKN